jgi:hypothetical protein
MSPDADVYRFDLIRAIVPARPAMTYPVHQPEVLQDYCELLADGAEARRLLRAKGYGVPFNTLAELVALVPAKVSKPKRKRKA